MASGCGRPGAIARAPAFGLGLRAAFFFLVLVESNPVVPAPAAGANCGVKVCGWPNGVRSGLLTFWNFGGFLGSVCSFGASGSGNWKVVCACAGAIARQAAAIGSAQRATVQSRITCRDVVIASLRQRAARKRALARDRRAFVNGR